jgi:serine/threonine protein kinase
MSLVGHRIGAYEVEALIGAGGMGEVYRALDTRLGRRVAIKVLPPQLFADPERGARFDREARLLASLAHPNIGTVYGLEDTEGTTALVLELIEGPTLAELIQQSASRRGLPLAQALDVAAQIVDALEAAHERGIIHRDLKPSNVKLTKDGTAKVIDFGLAKIVDGDQSAARLSHSPTLTAAGTRDGILLGTAAYMSPEQARGQAVDRRTDVWAFGCVLYEMLGGRSAFGRPTLTDTLAAVVGEEPDWKGLGPGTPPSLHRLLRRALDKDPKRRLRDIADTRIDLDEARIGLATRRRRARWPWAAAAVLASAAGAWFIRYPPNGAAGSSAAVRATFAQFTSDPGIEWFPSISPDGKWVLYSGDSSGNRDIFLQSISGQKPLNLTSDSPDDDDQAVFSPDGERIAFRSERDGGGIFVMGRTGEAVRRITRDGYRPSWSWDGTRLAYSTEPVDINPQNGRGPTELRIVDLRSGAVRRLTEAGLIVHATWSPHDQRLVVSVRNSGSRQMDIATIPVGGGALTPLVSDVATDWNAVWSADGRYVYYTSDAGGTMNLWRVRADESTGRALSAPEPVPTPSPLAAHPTLSRDGRRLAFSSVLVTTNIARMAFNPSTAEFESGPTDVTTGTRPWSSPDVSPNGDLVAFYSFQNPQGHVYVSRTDGTGLRQLTGDSAIDRVPRWSPDGQWLAFFSNRAGDYRVWKIHPDGSELQQMTSLGGAYPTWSPDGLRLATTEGVANRSVKLGAYIFDTRRRWDDQTPEALPPLRSDASSQYLFVVNSWSPDGSQIAGQSSLGATGIVTYALRSRTYLELTDFGEFPVWLPDNRRLLFAADGGKSYRVIDTATKQVRTVFRSPRTVFGPPRLTRDGRTAYFSRRITESDIWIVTLPDEGR